MKRAFHKKYFKASKEIPYLVQAEWLELKEFFVRALLGMQNAVEFGILGG